MQKPRPLSPHIQIYRPQITSVLSILHRITGVALSFGTVAMAYWLWAIAQGHEAYSTMLICMTHPLGHLALYGFTFALYYHLSNGIRHLVWDAGYGYELKTVTRSGIAVVLSALFLTALTWWKATGCGMGLGYCWI